MKESEEVWTTVREVEEGNECGINLGTSVKKKLAPSGRLKTRNITKQQEDAVYLLSHSFTPRFRGQYSMLLS